MDQPFPPPPPLASPDDAGGSGAKRPDPVFDEAALGDRLLAGDRTAAERLVEGTYARTFAALVKLCGDRDLAADLTQDTYRKAWTSLDSFRGDCLFSTWLYRIAYNTFLSHVRRPRAVALDDVEVVPPDPSPGAEERTIQRDQRRRLRRAVVGLAEPLRFAVTARYWGDLTSPEIASLEGLSAVGVRKRLLRALSSLEHALTHEASEVKS
jgi:RNA polymerase sigma-70 factor (ECF subfamily)